jgi:hypothetical protein
LDAAYEHCACRIVWRYVSVVMYMFGAVCDTRSLYSSSAVWQQRAGQR